MPVEVGGLEVLGGLGVQAGWIENEDEDRAAEDEDESGSGEVGRTSQTGQTNLNNH